jgi:hypothetical protein
MLRRDRHFIFLIAILALTATALPGCSGSGTTESRMMSIGDLPLEVQGAPAVVQEAYQFAAANPDVMKAIPCYCGCSSVGHTSNYSCYVRGQNTDGSLQFDNHALGCSICVDITLDTVRLLEQGKNMPEIRAYIDDTYGKYGTSNMPQE